MTQPAAHRLAAAQEAREQPTLVLAAATVTPRLYTITEAAQVLHVPEGWLRKKVSAGVVPHTRLGKHVRFTDAHIDQIITIGEQPPLPVVTATQGVSRRARRPS